MSITTITSRQFTQDAGSAKKAAAAGPVLITNRGRPAHVLLTFAAYQQLVGGGRPSFSRSARLGAPISTSSLRA